VPEATLSIQAIGLAYLQLQAQCNRISTMVVDRWGLSAVDWRPKKYDD
jgi:hypothetical protein